MQERREASLPCQLGDLPCASPLEHVEEAMRPMGVEVIAGVPSFVRGLAVARGAPIAVIDAVVGVVRIGPALAAPATQKEELRQR